MTKETFMLLRWVCLFLLVVSPVFGGNVGEAVAQDAVQTIALRVGHLIDPADGSVRHNQVILVEGKKIVAVGEAAGGKVTSDRGGSLPCLGPARLDGCPRAHHRWTACVG